MNGEIIKSFLVSLGFGVDDASLAKFNKSIDSAALRVTALYAGIQTAAAGIFYGISKISQGFEDMGYELRLVAPTMNRWLVLRQAMLTAYSKAGVNLVQVVQESIKFNYSLAKTKFAIEAAYKGVAAKFFPLLTKQMDIFRLKIFANMPKIQKALMGFVEFIFKAFQATIKLGSRVYSILTRVWDFFVRLDKATNGWSTIILGVIAAWKLLNLSFLATPFGMIIGALLTILALYDDFKVWQEGGKSFFNWGSETAKVVIGVATAIAAAAAAMLILKGVMFGLTAALQLWTTVQKVADVVLGIFTGELSLAAIAAAILEAPIWLIVGAITALIGVLTFADSKWKLFGGTVASFFSGVGNKVLEFFGGGPKVLASVGGPLQGGSGQAQPLLPASSNTNQNVNLQTNINVNGAADAHAVGKEVIGGQNRVNSDATRNFARALH